MKSDTRKIRLIMDLRNGGISDRRVLSAIELVPRDAFVPDVFKDRAYENSALPIGAGQTISQPLVVGLMTQALEVGPRDKVLEIGTGSGYQAAILSRLCRRLYTVERIRELLVTAEDRFNELGYTNIVTRYGDGTKGWPEQAPFDRIIVTAAAESFPEHLIEQLKVGGIMVAPIGDRDGTQYLHKIRRTEDGWEDSEMVPVRFVPLLGGRIA